MDFPLIGTDLCLRPWRASDAVAFHEAALESVGTVGTWMNWCHANYTLQETQDWINLCQQDLINERSYEMGVFSLDGAELYGGFGINLINHLHKYANIGYWVRESRQGHGLALDALRLAIEFGLHELQLRRLEIVVAENNLPSRKLAEKAGAHFEGILRNRLMVHGVSLPAAMYAVFPES